MGRRPCCEKEGMNRGAWTAMEDKILTDYISINGEGKWRNLPISAGLKRCGKSCRLRWLNYLRPDIKRGNITSDEKDLIIRLHKLLGNRWSLIAGRLPGRTDNEIKNYWNTTIGKKITHQLHARNRKEPMPTVSSLSHYNHQQNPQPPSLTCAIRTKATRCTKVIISKDLQNIQQKKNDEKEKKSFENAISSNDSMEMLLMGPNDVLNQSSVWVLDESKSSDLKTDTSMNMNDRIISNLLEAREFLPYSDFQHHQQQHDEQNGHTLITSPLMITNRFFEEDVHDEFDVDWITSLLHTELNQETSDKIF